jgi:hypothetical protein
MGTINTYNASGGLSTITLPALSTLNVGASCIVEKSSLDNTYNPVAFVANGSDTFDDANTGLTLVIPGEKRVLQVITISGTKHWKVTGGLNPKSGLASIASEFSLSNSTTATAIISTTLGPTVLQAGATYRITLMGTVQCAATSGTLTFTPFIQGTALAQTCQMATQGSAQGPVFFNLEYLITVRTDGTSGTAIAKPFGIINTSTLTYLASTSASATTVNTTATASSAVLKVQAQWATASTSNTLLVETATVERVV